MWPFRKNSTQNSGSSVRRNRPFQLRNEARPSLESLENRRLLAGDLAASLNPDGGLLIAGGAAIDNAVIQVQAADANLEVFDSGESIGVFRLQEITQVIVQLGSGDDTLEVIDPTHELDARGITWSIDAGEGDDTVLLTAERNSLDPWQAMRTVASLWTELETIANAMDQILTESLTDAAEGSIQEARDQITNLTDTWRQQAEAELFPQLEVAAGQFDAEIMGQFDALLGEFAEFGNRAEALVAASQSLLEPPGTGDHLVTFDGPPIAEIPGPGDYPDEFVEGETDVDAVIQDQNWEVEHQGLGDQLASLTNAAQVRAEEAEVSFSSQADQLQASADGSRTLAEQIASQAAELAARSESWADGVEASRIRAETDLQNQLANVRTMMDQVAPLLAHATAQLEQSAAKVAGLPNSDSRCQVTPKHQFQGGAGLDIFFPFSSPFQSWSISGGAGSDILFGGFVDDIISGGAGSDWLFGLRGNDLIHGDDGTDFLFGEFLVDIPFFSGDDCVYGDDGTDLIMGDNAIDTGNIGGKDDLHGGKGVDIVLGDDLTDVFTNGPGDDDTIHGDDDLDIMFATGGNDTVFGGLHIDAMFGGQGDDTLY
ncbi:MAG: hypothetical protein KDA87_23145, partial [Planctomycetales bacterium]|nr:hypothetical protein [Planctomycetales bacterium]